MAVIGAVGKELRPLSPGDRGFTAFKRKLLGISDILRQNRRDLLLQTRAPQVREQAAALLEEWENRSVSVIAGTEALNEAAAQCPELGESRIVLPS